MVGGEYCGFPSRINGSGERASLHSGVRLFWKGGAEVDGTQVGQTSSDAQSMRIDQPFAGGKEGQFGPIVNIELLHDRGAVGVDGLNAAV